jgi:hypothetical protein
VKNKHITNNDAYNTVMSNCLLVFFLILKIISSYMNIDNKICIYLGAWRVITYKLPGQWHLIFFLCEIILFFQHNYTKSLCMVGTVLLCPDAHFSFFGPNPHLPSVWTADDFQLIALLVITLSCRGLRRFIVWYEM